MGRAVSAATGGAFGCGALKSRIGGSAGFKALALAASHRSFSSLGVSASGVAGTSACSGTMEFIAPGNTDGTSNNESLLRVTSTAGALSAARASPWGGRLR